MKLNCWQVKKCGRQRGGEKTQELGICPVNEYWAANGIHAGLCAGRACWAVAGTLCEGKVQGTFATKMANCMECDFFKQVKEEEGKSYLMPNQIFQVIKEKQVILQKT